MSSQSQLALRHPSVMIGNNNSVQQPAVATFMQTPQPGHSRKISAKAPGLVLAGSHNQRVYKTPKSPARVYGDAAQSLTTSDPNQTTVPMLTRQHIKLHQNHHHNPSQRPVLSEISQAAASHTSSSGKKPIGSISSQERNSHRGNKAPFRAARASSPADLQEV